MSYFECLHFYLTVRSLFVRNWTDFQLFGDSGVMLNQPQRALLQALFTLARDDRPADLVNVANQLGLSCVQTDKLLTQLDEAGFVDATRVRLTMTGLVLAASLGPLRRQSRNAA